MSLQRHAGSFEYSKPYRFAPTAVATECIVYRLFESRNKVKWVKMNNKKQILLMLEHVCSYSY